MMAKGLPGQWNGPARGPPDEPDTSALLKSGHFSFAPTDPYARVEVRFVDPLGGLGSHAIAESQGNRKVRATSDWRDHPDSCRVSGASQPNFSA